MRVAELLESIGIEERGVFDEDGLYTIDVPDCETYEKLYSKLSDSLELLPDEDECTLRESGSRESFLYNDEYKITLISNLLEDTYSMVVENLAVEGVLGLQEEREK